ncbi:hypothetical protein [Phenylobacterium sp.]|uniref:hypothetical protein n=1 Tax=Phenylobacterium sp. TaxID=1871053 RepID=UPI002BBC60BD|nr:hypothetical protein [Phenylobacterium sp.]HLZ74086.1 hypothetical protein [Phenylobacterium sp.]
MQAILLLREWDQGVGVFHIMAFLYVCENEGLNVQELTDISGMSQSSASRCLRELGMLETDSPRSLLRAHANPRDGRSYVIRLTPCGRQLRDRLDAVIRKAEPIVPDPARRG